MNDFFKSLAKLTQDFIIPVSKFDSDQVKHSLGTMKALSVSTQRRAGSGTPRTHQQALLLGRQPGNHLRGGNLLRGGKHQVGMNIFSIPDSRCFAYKQWRFPCRRRAEGEEEV